MFHKWQSFDVCFLRYGVRQKFYPPSNSENQMLGDIIILHMCNIMGNHMMYGSWDIDHNRHKFFWFWIIFCPFYLPTTWEIKILKRWKKNTWRYITLHKSIMTIIRCMVPEVWSTTDRIFYHFGSFLTSFYPY